MFKLLYIGLLNVWRCCLQYSRCGGACVYLSSASYPVSGLCPVGIATGTCDARSLAIKHPRGRDWLPVRSLQPGRKGDFDVSPPELWPAHAGASFPNYCLLADTNYRFLNDGSEKYAHILISCSISPDKAFLCRLKLYLLSANIQPVSPASRPTGSFLLAKSIQVLPLWHRYI